MLQNYLEPKRVLNKPLIHKIQSGVSTLLYSAAVIASALLMLDVAVPWLARQVLQPFRGVLESLPEVEMNLVFYLVMLVFIVPSLWIWGKFFQAKWADLGVGKMRHWYLLLLIPLIATSYMMLTILISLLFTAFVPGFNGTEKQEIGITPDGSHNLLLLAIFLCIVVPLLEEFVFRGYLFGLLRRNISFLATTIVVSLLFATLHLLFDTSSSLTIKQFNVALDVFVLSLFLSYLRERTNSIWAGVGLHGLKNFIAFLLLFVFEITI